jgi:hypothetical protein
MDGKRCFPDVDFTTCKELLLNDMIVIKFKFFVGFSSKVYCGAMMFYLLFVTVLWCYTPTSHQTP